MNSMPEINPTNLQTPRTDVNSQDTSSPDKTEFASLVEKEYSKSAESKTDKKEIYSESAMKGDAVSKGDNSSCSNCTTDIAGKKNDRQETGDVEPVNRDDEQKKDEVKPEHGLKTGALLFSLLQGYITEKGNALQVSTGEGTSEKADAAAAEPGSGPASENGLKIGTLLNNMISDYAAETGGGLNPGTAGEQHAELLAAESSDVPAENGLKVGDLLNNMMSDYAAETGGLNPGTAGEQDTELLPAESSDVPAENGLKVGTLLNHMMSDNAAETGGGLNPGPAGQQGAELLAAESSDVPAGNGLKVGTLLNHMMSDSAAETGGGLNPGPAGEQHAELRTAESSDSPADNGLKAGTMLNNLVAGYKAEIEEGAESGKVASDTHGENGLKMGQLLNRLAGRSDEDEIKKGPVKEEMVSAEKIIEIKAEDDDSEADSLIFRKEIAGQAETKNRTSGHVEKIHSDDRVVNVDTPETSDNSKGLNSRTASGPSGQFKQDNGTGDHAFNFAKGTHNSGNDAETNNINSIHTSNTTYENARSVQGLSALPTAKTPGVQELLDNVVYVIKGNSKMGVSVEHENLGKLNISLSLEKGLVNVHINTSDRVVRELLENNIQQIVDTLNKDGVSVGEFSVALRDQKEHEINHFSLKNGQAREILHETKKDYRHSGLVNIFA